MKKLLPPILALLVFGCSPEPAPVEPNSSGVSARDFADLKRRIDTLEQMIRTLDKRDSQIAELATSSSSMHSAPSPAARPAADGQPREEIQVIGDDLLLINQRITALTEQLAAIGQGVEGLAEAVTQNQTKLNTHEQVIERILSGN